MKYMVSREYKAVVREVFVIEADSKAEAEEMNGPVLANGFELFLPTESSLPSTKKVAAREVPEIKRRLFVRPG